MGTSHHHTYYEFSVADNELDIAGHSMNTAETVASPSSALALHRSGSAVTVT